MNEEFYFNALKEIRKRYKYWRPRDCAYMFFDWYSIFSEAEKLVWNDLRGISADFYPQWPAGNYYIDFADPIRKIGIEVDGKEYHQDFLKDIERQKKLEEMGWKIIRISGVEVMENRENYLRELLPKKYNLENENDDFDEGDEEDKKDDN